MRLRPTISIRDEKNFNSKVQNVVRDSTPHSSIFNFFKLIRTTGKYCREEEKEEKKILKRGRKRRKENLEEKKILKRRRKRRKEDIEEKKKKTRFILVRKRNSQKTKFPSTRHLIVRKSTNAMLSSICQLITRSSPLGKAIASQSFAPRTCRIYIRVLPPQPRRGFIVYNRLVAAVP